MKFNSSTRVDLVDRVRIKESVSNYVMPTSHDENNGGIYTLADLSVAVMFEVMPIASSVMSDSELEQASDAIANAISRIKPPAFIQSIVLPSSNVEDDIQNYLAQGGDSHPLLAMHAEKIAENFRKSVAKPLYTLSYGEGGFRTKRYRILFAVVIRPDSMVGGAAASVTDFIASIFSRLKPRSRSSESDEAEGQEDEDVGSTPAERRYLGLRENLYRRISEAARRVEGSFRTVHMPVRRVTPSELLAHFGSLLSPLTSGSKRYRYDPTQQIAHQIPQGDLAIEASSGSILTDGVVYKVLSLCGLPKASSPGAATLPQASLGYYTLLDFVGDGFMTVSASAKDRLDVQKYAETRKTRALNDYVLPTKKDEVIRDCNMVIAMTDQDKRQFFDTQLTICIYGRSEREVQERAEKLRDKASEIGLECRIEQNYAPSLFFQSLPMGFAPTVPEARRLWMLPDRAVSDLLPVYMYSRGSKHAQVLLHNRLGEPFRFSFFDSPTAQHFLLAGESGSGKSFWVSNYVYNAIRVSNSQAFLIDKGKSYTTIAAMLGTAGQNNSMGLGGGTCINAFAGTQKTSGSFLKELIGHLASQSAADRLSAEQRGVIDECVTKTYKSNQTEVTYRTIEEIYRRYPKGAWIDIARKRMLIHPLDEGQRLRVAQLKSRDVGRDPQFEIYHRAKLLQRRYVNRETGTVTKTEEITDARSVDQKTVQWLTSRQYKLEDMIGEDGYPCAVILYKEASAERTLDNDGFIYTPLRDRLVLAAERRDDVIELEECDIKVDYPQEYIAERRRDIHAKCVELHPKAKTDAIDELVHQKMADMRPRDYFDAIEGVCIIQNEVFLRDFIRCLQEHPNQNLAPGIISRLSAYYGEGTQSGFFDGETTFTLEGKKLVNFELGELSTAGPHLTAAVVGLLLQMLLLYCQSEHLPNGGPRSFEKYIILDEVWALIEVPMIFDLIKNGLKTLRKHSTAVGLISQRIRDFADSENGRVILSSVQHRVVLRQQAQEIPTFAEAMGWSQEKIALMYSVHSSDPPGLYSEALIECTTTDICEVTRLVANPYSYWLFTTTPADLKHRDKVKAGYRANATVEMTQDEALAAALDECARTYPNGIKSARAAAKPLADMTA